MQIMKDASIKRPHPAMSAEGKAFLYYDNTAVNSTSSEVESLLQE